MMTHHTAGAAAHLAQSDLFVSGQEGHHTFRIPALAVTARGVLLAFAEGRKDGGGDAGVIALLLKRSFDHGVTWQPLQAVATRADMTCGNPCPVLDRTTGKLWLLFCQNLADGDERLIVEGKAPRTVWLTFSNDDGATWAPPREITANVKAPTWTWYATGPTHGIQLRSGRFVIPCDHIKGVYFDHQRDSTYSHVIDSDDHGATWQSGGTVTPGTDECAVIETVTGALYLNCRDYAGGNRRAVAWSVDQGATFGPVRWEETLIEPICQGRLVRLSHGSTERSRRSLAEVQPQHMQNRILFANPASTAHKKLTEGNQSHDHTNGRISFRFAWLHSHPQCAGSGAFGGAQRLDRRVATLADRPVVRQCLHPILWWD